MFLKDFKEGWSNKFEERFNALFKLVPDLEVVSVKRFNGMLRSEFKHSDENIEYILNSVAFKIERESAKTCEVCGKFGRRKTDLPETMCLCWECHVITLDEFISSTLSDYESELNTQE